MSKISAEEAGGVNRCAFLDAIAFSEGTSTSPITKNDGYDVVVTGVKGPRIFSDYSTHPNIIVKVNTEGLYSTAAGRYQLLYRYYRFYAKTLGLDNFDPLSQDRIALRQIKEKGALVAIDAGYLRSAVGLCSSIWASLPGSIYGQHVQPFDIILNIYLKAGGSVKEAI